jgi:hypothetical protein
MPLILAVASVLPGAIDCVQVHTQGIIFDLRCEEEDNPDRPSVMEIPILCHRVYCLGPAALISTCHFLLVQPSR